jgi:hypothetical protein
MNFENKYVKIDFEGFPQVIIAIKDHAPTAVEFDEFLAAMKHTYANEKDRIVLFDLVNAQNVPILFQLKFARWSNAMKPIFKKHLKGVTLHVGNKLIKSVLKIIFFFQKPNYEYQILDHEASVTSHQNLLRQRLL